jgi:hypothetical protein
MISQDKLQASNNVLFIVLKLYFNGRRVKSVLNYFT